MDQIEFIFQTNEYDVEKLMPQVRWALEKRMKLKWEKLSPVVAKRMEKATNSPSRGGLFRKKKQEEEPVDKFEQAAKEFLSGQEEYLKEKAVEICFSDEEMIIVAGALEDLDQDAIEFDDIELILETPDTYLIIYDQGRGVLIQKKDITLGTVEEFRHFVSTKIRPVVSMPEEE